MVLEISNRVARHFWLQSHGLMTRTFGQVNSRDLLQTIEKLGFVQLDSIQITARAHHHILWSRHSHYREHMLDDLICKRAVFEHFTHDASVLPMKFYPFWRRQFAQMAKTVSSGKRARHIPDLSVRKDIISRIEKNGPLCSRDFKGGPKADKSIHLWMRPPHKIALDYLWYKGGLATAYRRNFEKYYDLGERVFPNEDIVESLSEQQQIDWLCEQALARLGFANANEIAKFWGAVSHGEAKAWIERQESKVITVDVNTAEGEKLKRFAFKKNAQTFFPLAEQENHKVKKSLSGLMILNPFDPAIRDRKRLHDLFGFDYRIEIFTPALKRKYGYYVCPMLEGTDFIGRIEVKADRKHDELRIENIWWEEGGER